MLNFQTCNTGTKFQEKSVHHDWFRDIIHCNTHLGLILIGDSFLYFSNRETVL